LYFPKENRLFTRKKGSKMSLKDVLRADRLESNREETMGLAEETEDLEGTSTIDGKILLNL